MAEESPPPANGRLSELLHRAGWRPETLARRLNTVLASNGSDRRIHDKTPYRWIRGEVPHGEVPDLVVQILAGTQGTELTYEQVWNRARTRGPAPLRADHGCGLPWDSAGLLSLLGEPVPTRRIVLAVTGAAITGPAWACLDHPAPTLASAADAAGRVTPPLLTMINGIVTHAQQLDDQQGGAARAFVADQYSSLARLMKRASYDAATGRRLAAALAQLAQTNGFMAFDAAEDGHAQRWYLLALRAAHAAGDRALAASILALMSNQAADRGHPLDALQLANAAQHAARHAPGAVRSLIATRNTLAYAAAGDLTGFNHMHDQAATIRNEPTAEPGPSWAGYIDHVELDAITGRGLVVLAEHLPRQQTRLLRQAAHLLHARAYTPHDATPQRSALRHGAWLSLAHLAALRQNQPTSTTDDLDHSITAARSAITRLPTVSSVRSVRLLHRVATEVTPVARRSPAARALLHDLRTALAPTA
ncbi:hypothetical protein [Actinoplanes couchii]|uniref:Transcriptional regulator n=1 Tax=Actinoplanes couchii TaxID=403638 RepID=A0ABQ3XNV2_9ACTN|nr:hypothetical protein [Actinoplanes couchii]MDR6318600.1 hypothetical protein [Actinoplanes couchii]GID60209.1 hypothetical protein Aco03nite_086130 [Actinoplanes couchii]